MKRLNMTLTAVALLITGAGCEQSSPDREVDSFDQLHADNVILSVNGQRYTRAGFERTAALDDAIVSLLLKGASADAVSRKEKILAHVADQRLSSKVLEMIAVQAAQSRGIKISEEELKAKRSECVKSFGRGKLNETEVSAFFKEKNVLDEFGEMVRRQALVDAYYQDVFTNSVKITDDYIKNYISFYRRQRSDALATNVLIYAMASNVCERARSGEDFLSLYRQYTNVPVEDRPEEGEFFECDSFSFTANQDTWKVVSSLGEGEVTDVIEQEDCLVIYKLVRHIINNVGSQKLYVGRIRFRRAVVPGIPTVDEAKGKVRDAFYEETVKHECERLRQSAIIEFPCGTKFFTAECCAALKKLGIELEK